MTRSAWMTWTAVCSLALAITSPASVANAAEDSPAKDAEAKEVSDPVICRSVSTSGSRLKSEKVCRKKSEWAGDASNAKEYMKAVDKKSSARTRGPTPVGR